MLRFIYSNVDLQSNSFATDADIIGTSKYIYICIAFSTKVNFYHSHKQVFTFVFGIYPPSRRVRIIKKGTEIPNFTHYVFVFIKAFISLVIYL